MSAAQNIRSKLTQKFKYLRRDVRHRLGFYDDFYKNARGGRIIIYHGICLTDHTRFNPIFLTLKTFEDHLKFYKEHFNVISLDDYYEGKFCNDKFNICLTFDDGFANNYKYVLPLLQKYQLPATFFVTAIRAAGYDILWNDFLGIISKYGPAKIIYRDECYYKGKHNKYISRECGVGLAEMLRSVGFDEKAEMMKLLYPVVPFKLNKEHEDYWLQMTEEQIKALARSPLVTIGSHGYFHNDLSRVNIKYAGKELTFSKQYLEGIIEKPVTAFAFPYGAYTPGVVAMAKKAGYSQLLAMDFYTEEDQQDDTMRERFTVNPFISTNNQMYAAVTRKYEH